VAVGAYPGTFDPPTVAHLAIAEAALSQGGLERVHLVVSREPRGKHPTVPSFEHRVDVLEAVATSRPWLEVRVSSRRLIVDVVAGYDAVIMGADKWSQVIDPYWYGGVTEARDKAVAALPRLLLAERGGGAVADTALPPGALVLRVTGDHQLVSSSAVRAGRAHWMAPEAALFDARTGAWSDPERYRRRHETNPEGPGD
jgi:cytidyltransferase-like protein